MSELTERCETCRFWNHDARDSYGEDEAFSYCRRYPPSMGFYHDVDENFTAMFPITVAYDWCGEWQPITPKEDNP